MERTIPQIYDDEDMPLAEALEAARKLGEEHGKNGASWVFDGNTSRETYEAAVRGMDDGDPAVLDVLGVHEPDLHGDFTTRDLCEEIGVNYDLAETRDVDKIADAYREAAWEAYWPEVERAARYQLSDED